MNVKTAFWHQTVKLKHSSEITISKTHFWVEEDFELWRKSLLNLRMM